MKTKLGFAYTLTATALLALPLTMTACKSTQKSGDASALKVGQAELLGVLRSGQVAIGGETTGWVLLMDTGSIDIDVTKVAGQASQLDGKRSVVSGEIITKTYPTRGEVKVMVAESIIGAPASAPPAVPTIPPPPRPQKM
jgi:hypothetical protein